MRPGSEHTIYHEHSKRVHEAMWWEISLPRWLEASFPSSSPPSGVSGASAQSTAPSTIGVQT